MPLSASAPREHLHTREIECRGYRRADGLWDIEAHLTDVKTYAFESDWRGTVEPGTAVHDMWLRLTLDDDLVVRAVEAVTDASPFQVCPEVTPNYQRLIGLSIRPGFMPKARELLGEGKAARICWSCWARSPPRLSRRYSPTAIV